VVVWPDYFVKYCNSMLRIQNVLKHVRLRGRSVALFPEWSFAALLFLLFLALYIRTAAPSVLSGDSAEFQLAAALLGVPHPTTYPLYILLGHLATLLLPLGDLAWRVTIVSAVCAALAVALFFLLARRITASGPAALVGALALGLAPGLWNAATLAEVYALLAALLVGLCYLIETKDEGPRTKDQGPADQPPLLSNLRPPTPNTQHPIPNPYLAAFVGGLGFAHHGLFAIVGMPLLAGYLLWTLIQTSDERPRTNDQGGKKSPWSFVLGLRRWPPGTLRQLALLGLCFAAGLLPWVYPLAQYARYGPFSGQDYGLPRHYFWGAPESWGQALDLLTGGTMRRGIFRIPSIETIGAVMRLVGRRLLFEFGPLGAPLGLFGAIVLLRRARLAWLGAAWIFFATLAYLLLLGPAVQDAPVFTLPMLLPWALWIAAGVEYVLAFIGHTAKETRRQGDKEIGLGGLSRSPNLPVSLSRWGGVMLLALLVAATLAWGYTRVRVSSKRQLWLYRRFGEAVLAQLPPGAAVIAHWEQGMTLQYLTQVEGRRPDVWVDVVEPSDEDWGNRADRYVDRPIFFIGGPADVAELPVQLAREDDYADVFELRR
jgi:hypothetical protein